MDAGQEKHMRTTSPRVDPCMICKQSLAGLRCLNDLNGIEAAQDNAASKRGTNLMKWKIVAVEELQLH